jgi:hypothetical protein
LYTGILALVVESISRLFRQRKSGDDMAADNIRYDDFIANVHADPAKPEAAIMLAGFVGHGAEGKVRIYPDASLANWYDVAEDDVVHAMPVPDAKLGGSYVWVRASAQITPGAAAAPAAAGTGAVAAAQPAMPFTLTCTLEAAAPATQVTGGPDCAPYQTQANCCTMVGNACRPVGGWPPSLGCQPSVMACPHAAALGAGTVTGFFGCTAACPPAALGAGTVTGFFGCTAACPPAALGAQTVTGFFGCTAACPPAALHAQTNPPTLGCTGGCNALGMAQTFTQGLPCQHLRGGIFTPFRG